MMFVKICSALQDRVDNLLTLPIPPFGLRTFPQAWLLNARIRNRNLKTLTKRLQFCAVGFTSWNSQKSWKKNLKSVKRWLLPATDQLKFGPIIILKAA